MRKNKNINNEQEVKEAQNRYARFQRENPHTPRTMKALGLPEKDIEEFCTDALFPYVIMEHLDKFQQVIKDYKDDGRYRTFNDIIRKRGDYLTHLVFKILNQKYC